MICASCRNTISSDRCKSEALPSLQFCGKHIRMKTKRLWVDVNNVYPKACLIQKIWRGFSVRNWIKQAGVGCMKRSLCHNDEELVTLESKETIHPFDFFSFEECGKIWCFNSANLASITFSKYKPTNPYTRQLLTIDTRRRLRRVIQRNNSYRVSIHDASGCWRNISQILEENGFEEVNPIFFESMNKTQFVVFLQLLKSDLDGISAETPKNIRKQKYVILVKHFLKKYTPFTDQAVASRKVASLLHILLENSNPYPLCFAIMSALTRL
jgi:hypothetical protein